MEEDINSLNGIPIKKLNKRVNQETNNSQQDIINIPLNQLESAPDDWNFFGELPANKMAELIESIGEIGILNPIIVWKKSDGKYMILSGHNRVRVYNILKEKEDYEKYSQIRAIVKGTDEIDENTAKQIIVDTNWVQRELTVIQKAKAIQMKYAQIKKEKKGNTIRTDINEIISEQYNMKKRQLIEYKSLNKLIDNYNSYLNSGEISIKAGVKISKLSEDNQKYIFNNYVAKGKIKTINKNCSKLTKELQKEEIDIALSEEDIGQELGCIKIEYPSGKTNEEWKTAHISYNKEDEPFIKELVAKFLGEDSDEIVLKGQSFKSSSFSYKVEDVKYSNGTYSTNSYSFKLKSR